MPRLSRLVLHGLVSLSVALMPYSTLHAHVSDHEEMHVHGGHMHDFDPDHDAKSVDQIVTVSVTANAWSPAAWDWTDSLPLLCVVALLSLTLPFVTAVLRPPARDSEPIPRRPHHQPPLRGPPASIHAI